GWGKGGGWAEDFLLAAAKTSPPPVGDSIIDFSPLPGGLHPPHKGHQNGDTIDVDVEATGDPDGPFFFQEKTLTNLITLSLSKGAKSDTFTLSFGGETTSALDRKVAATDLQQALVKLPFPKDNSAGVQPKITVTGNDGGPYEIAFFGYQLTDKNLEEITAAGTGNLKVTVKSGANRVVIGKNDDGT